MLTKERDEEAFLFRDDLVAATEQANQELPPLERSKGVTNMKAHKRNLKLAKES